jgi:hypothetical protein
MKKEGDNPEAVPFFMPAFIPATFSFRTLTLLHHGDPVQFPLHHFQRAA